MDSQTTLSMFKNRRLKHAEKQLRLQLRPKQGQRLAINTINFQVQKMCRLRNS
jgi:hypothetical protein